MQAVAICGLSVLMCCFVAWQSNAEAASECYLKCFMTGGGARVCVVEGHRLYDKITMRTDRGDQCLTSVEQARSAGFSVLGAPAQAEAQRPPVVIPAAPIDTPEPLPEDTPAPASDATQPEPEQVAETVAPESPETSGQAERAAETVVEEAPSGGEMSPLESEKQVLIAKMTNGSLDMAEREQAYRQLMNLPGLTEEERQGIEFAWSFVNEGGAKTMAVQMLKAVLLGPVGIGLLLVFVFFIVCGWILFAKADVPGWLSLIPIVNLFFAVKISGKPIWWFILFFVPVVNIIASLIVCLGLAERFGKGAFMGIVLFFLPFIGLPILAFTGEYQG